MAALLGVTVALVATMAPVGESQTNYILSLFVVDKAVHFIRVRTFFHLLFAFDFVLLSAAAEVFGATN